MTDNKKTVDGFRFMSPSLRTWLSSGIPKEQFSSHIPWTPMKKPNSRTTFSLMTSAGISMKIDPAFNMEREKRELTWGDPAHREISRDSTEADILLSHSRLGIALVDRLWVP
jgi:hypothetical protein